MSERHHHGDGYIIVGPFILSFGLVGAFLKGVLIVVAVLAIPAGLAMTVYATYRPARELGNSKRANASAVLTTLGWVMLFTGVAFLFEDAPLKILPWIGGLILLRLPFAWIDPNRRKKPARPLSHVRLLLWRVYVACERAPRWLLLIPGITCVAAWVAFVSLFEKSQTAFVIHSAQDVTSLLLGLPLFAVFFSVLFAVVVLYPAMTLLALAEPDYEAANRSVRPIHPWLVRGPEGGCSFPEDEHKQNSGRK